MAKEIMQLEIDSDLKNEFIKYVDRAYNGRTDEGIRDLMRIYVERAKGMPGQKDIKQKVKETVFNGGSKSALTPREIEKMILNKTDEEIEAARLDKKH